MNENTLYQVTERIIENERITAEDVAFFTQQLFRDGLISRDEADVLIALDRAIERQDPSWSGALAQLVGEFVVWTSRPTGLVDGETAQWLTSSLSCGKGPTDNAARIAFEIVREAERVDSALISFALRTARARFDDDDSPKCAPFRGVLAA